MNLLRRDYDQPRTKAIQIRCVHADAALAMRLCQLSTNLETPGHPVSDFTLTVHGIVQRQLTTRSRALDIVHIQGIASTSRISLPW